MIEAVFVRQDRVGCRSTDPAVAHANVVEPIMSTENVIFYDNIEVNRKEASKNILLQIEMRSPYYKYNVHKRLSY